MSSTNTNIAQELADEQKQTSIAEFFEKNKQMLGFGSKNRALVTAVKEGVDNSLDAAEEARILPTIEVDIEEKDDFYTVTIEDNGPGIPPESVPSVFGKLLYGSRFHREMQQRGQQGIGISAAVLYSQLTTGNPARITSKTEEQDKAYYVEIGINTDKNNPEIHNEEYKEWSKSHGIRIELDMETNLRSRKRLHQYIRNTAVSNPHAVIKLSGPEKDLIFDDRPVSELPDEVEEIKPHPHGIELGTLMDMLDKTDKRKLKPFLKSEFTRVGDKTANSIIKNFRDVHFGRWLGIRVQNLDEDKIRSVVNNKRSQEKDEFISNIQEEIQEMSHVTYIDIQNIVSSVSEDMENTFGETVQRKTTQEIYNQILDYTYQTIHEITSEKTVRKSEELVKLFAEKLSDRIVDIQHDSYQPITEKTLKSNIQDVGKSVSRNENIKGSFGEKAQEKVFDAIWNMSKTTEKNVPDISEFVGDRDLSDSLLQGMKRSDAMAPPKKCISPIKKENIVKGLKSRYDADFYTAVTRDADVQNGKPFVVEAGIAYGGELESDSQINLQRFANRVPLVYQQGACLITKQVKSISWNNYYRASDDLSQNSGSLPKGPMVLVVHVGSTNVPFTSESKDAIASVPEIQKEVKLAVRNVARNLKKHLKTERRRKKQKEKRDVIGDILSRMSRKLEEVTDEPIESKEESQARILNNLFIRQSGDKTIRTTNYGGKSYTVEFEIQTEQGNNRKRTCEVAKDESTSVSVNESIKEFSVTNPDETKVTIK